MVSLGEELVWEARSSLTPAHLNVVTLCPLSPHRPL